MVCLDKSHCDSGDPRDGEEGTAERDSLLSPEDGDGWVSITEGWAPADPQTGGEGKGGNKAEIHVCKKRG